MNQVHITLEAIGSGDLRPSQLLLWLDEEKLLDDLPPTLKRLAKRGLEIRRTANFGPHKKYFPYVLSQSTFSKALVTADDDILYPAWWLKGLHEASSAAPRDIHCYRAHRVAFSGSDFRPYASWPREALEGASPLNFATGVSGVIYPPAFQEILKRRGDLFEDLCPRADDVWLHQTAVQNDFLISQVFDESVHFNVIPGTQAAALMHDNVAAGANDGQIMLTYSELDRQKLRHASEAVPIGDSQ